MNAEHLLAHFERISEAPDAIARLRRFILDLAVRGKLVEPPRSWLECSLGDVGDWGSGGTPLRTKPEYYGGDIPWLVIGDLNDGLVTASATTITEEGLSSSSAKVVDEGTLLIAMYGSIGKLGVAGMRCATNQAIAFCRPYSDMVTGDYLFILLKSLRNELLLQGQGVAQQNISQKILKAHPVELPALAEQHRIVAKVNELMALCDQLEAARQQREQHRERLMAATLQRLNQPTADPASFRQDASFALQVLPSLTTTPAQIKQLRQTILNLAVRGKLVVQDPEDESAEELLNFITKHKRASLPTTTDESPFPFELPSGWVNTTLRSLVESSCSGWSPKTLDSPREGDEWGILKVSAVSWDRFRPEANKQVLPGTQPRPQAVVRKGDFLISRANTAELVARAVVIDSEPVNLMMSDKIVRLELAELCEPKYILINNNHTSFARNYYAGRATGVSPSMKNVTRDVILDLPIPLPPLAEQHRIVAKVDELMALCDQLEQQLSQADQQRRRLLEALLAEALGGRLPTEQEESHAAVA